VVEASVAEVPLAVGASEDFGAVVLVVSADK